MAGNQGEHKRGRQYYVAQANVSSSFASKLKKGEKKRCRKRDREERDGGGKGREERVCWRERFEGEKVGQRETRREKRGKREERRRTRGREREREQGANERTLTLFLFLSSPSLRSFSSQECSFPQESYTSSSSPFLSLFTHFFHLGIFSLSNLSSPPRLRSLYPESSSFVPLASPSPSLFLIFRIHASFPALRFSLFLQSTLAPVRFLTLPSRRGENKNYESARHLSSAAARSRGFARPCENYAPTITFLPRWKCLTLAWRIIKEIIFSNYLRIYIYSKRYFERDNWNETNVKLLLSRDKSSKRIYGTEFRMIF